MTGKVPDAIKAYLCSRPLLLKYSLEGIVNVASLARKIKAETGMGKSDEAFIVYLHRFLASAKTKGGHAASFEQIMVGSTINLRTGFAVLVLKGDYPHGAHAIISFGKTSVVIDEERTLSKHSAGAEYFCKDLILLEIKHGRNIEDDVGTVFMLISKLAERDISMAEVFSAYDATYILAEKKHYLELLEIFLPAGQSTGVNKQPARAVKIK